MLVSGGMRAFFSRAPLRVATVPDVERKSGSNPRILGFPLSWTFTMRTMPCYR